MENIFSAEMFANTYCTSSRTEQEFCSGQVADQLFQIRKVKIVLESLFLHFFSLAVVVEV